MIVNTASVAGMIGWGGALYGSTKGAIVNLASTRAFMSQPDTEAYSASKGGVYALTHALAASLAPDVRVTFDSDGGAAAEAARAALTASDTIQVSVGGKPRAVRW